MKIAVTGATGFIGRHLIAELLANDIEVVAVSRSSRSPFTPTERLTHCALDMAEPKRGWYECMGKPDVLLHLAWGGLPNYRSGIHLEQELPMQQRFLRGCLESGLRRLVVTGTCLEYGMQSGMLSEDLPAMPCTAYAEAKTRLHAYLQELAPRHGLQLTWLRFFYLYGPGQAATSLYSQLREALTEGCDEFAMSPGDQIRDFLPVEKAAAYIRQIALSPRDAGLVNVCSGVPTTVSAIVQEWLRAWHAKIRLNTGVYPYPDYEPLSFWGDTRRLHQLLGLPY